jgi:hypothetical protein
MDIEEVKELQSWAFTKGHQEGHSQGWQRGFDAGVDEGLKEGNIKGHEEAIANIQQSDSPNLTPLFQKVLIKALPFLKENQKIPAIKEVRDITGLGLKEAKTLTEALELILWLVGEKSSCFIMNLSSDSQWPLKGLEPMSQD